MPLSTAPPAFCLMCRTAFSELPVESRKGFREDQVLGYCAACLYVPPVEPVLTLTHKRLPTSQAEYEALVGPRNSQCRSCSSKFTGKNVHSALGWRETQISGFCDDCFDNLFQEE